MTEWTDDDWDARYQLIYKCQVSSLYHRKRERFFALLDKVSAASALVAGAGAMSDLLPTAATKAVAGALVAAVTLPGIVFSWSDRSRTFALLAAKFIALEAEIEGAGVLNCDQLAKLKERALHIEMEEPPQLSALTRICQNEIARAMGAESSVKKLTWMEKFFAQFLDMPSVDLAV